ncbi:MAG: thiolase family protein, partial [Nocardia sp.]|nr:thiolase family protein [Nocardia sp.]
MTEQVSIIGSGLSRFGRQPGVSGRQMAVAAITAAVADAGLTWPDIQVAFGGSDGSGAADTLVAELGFTGIPFTNVKNGCATGGSALFAAVNAIRSGAAEIALAVGFDKHPRGAFDPDPADWGLPEGYGSAGLMVTTQFFGAKIGRYMREHNISAETLARVAAKAYRNGSRNPNAWRREPVPVEEIAAAEMVNDPLTKLMFCSPGEGGAAVVVASAAAARRLAGRPVRLRAISH